MEPFPPLTVFYKVLQMMQELAPHTSAYISLYCNNGILMTVLTL
jgi:hypothetical protein